MTKKALIVVDVQNDFISGTLAVQDGEQTAHRIATVLDRTPYDIVVYTQDWHVDPGEHFSATPDFKDTWPVHCKALSWGAQLHQDLIDHPFTCRTATFHKGMYSAAYSGFEATENEYGALLVKWLKAFEVTDVDIVGIATDYCVKATALDAVKWDFNTTVLLPYCASVAPDTAAAALDEMREAGVNIPAMVD